MGGIHSNVEFGERGETEEWVRLVTLFFARGLGLKEAFAVKFVAADSAGEVFRG